MGFPLYMDEDSMDQRLVRALRARGMDVETAIDADMIARSDKAHLAYAAETGRALHTFNVSDFYQLHAEFLEADRNHAGLISVPQQRYRVGEHMTRLLRLNAERTASEMRNRVVFLTSAQE
jgi:hypothetical protein